MKHLLWIIVLAAYQGIAAQDWYSVTLEAIPPTPADALLGTASLALEGATISYDLHLTGRWLGNLSPGMDRPTPLITLEGVTSSTPVTWWIASFEGPLDWWPAHYTFRGTVSLADSAVAELIGGQTTLSVDYGEWGGVSGAVLPIPEPAPLALGAALVLVLVGSRTLAKSACETEPGASPNGGPAERLGISGVGGGPPSVS